MVDTGGAQRHPAATERLMEYWAHGEGAAKIQWGVPGDFDRCVVELGKYVSPGVVKGLCSNLHQRATGARPGHAPGEEASRKAKGGD
ncbi:hypothetical protein [Streptomyces sparsogenes]|uniref:hypothetical protein n=1 Tax=Streptomyces sparsogenes TaxID=67365 RepID=UPI000978DCCE|nr:hypothetical protein [Streptomyces sparsogenes]